MSESIIGREDITNQELEAWLEASMVPVDPDDRFVRKLQARLIRFHGKRPFSIWMVIGTVAMALLIIIGWVTLLMRAVFLLLTLVGLFDRRGSQSQPSTL